MPSIDIPKRTESLRRARRLFLLAAAGGVVSACGGGGGGSNSPAPAPAPIPTLPPVPEVPVNGPAWAGFGGDAQHSAVAQIAAQRMDGIYWYAAVDESPQLTNGSLLAHYGSPAITRHNTVLMPVRRVDGGFDLRARAGATGRPLWALGSDYVLPPHRWVPSYNPVLTPAGRLLAPLIGGRVAVCDNPDSPTPTFNTITFYGETPYIANAQAFNATVFISTPLTSDSSGNVYFGVTVTGANPAALGGGGIVRLGANGSATFVAATTATGTTDLVKPATNCAPALSLDEGTVYVVVNTVPTQAGIRPSGRLLALDATTLATRAQAALLDPASGQSAHISDDASSSPLVGPDGDVYFGVLEAPDSTHNFRGWLLHFNAALTQTKTPGSFGWDNTPSVVPRAMIPAYAGPSNYLLLSKYNNYGGLGDGLNRIAILDPGQTQTDPIRPGVAVMREVMTQLGPTADPSYPGGRKEWCVNTAAVDPATRSVLVNSEDGVLYRWSLPDNRFTEQVRLNGGLFQSYTPTAVGPDGRIYTINNATLHSIGQRP